MIEHLGPLAFLPSFDGPDQQRASFVVVDPLDVLEVSYEGDSDTSVSLRITTRYGGSVRIPVGPLIVADGVHAEIVRVVRRARGRVR